MLVYMILELLMLGTKRHYWIVELLLWVIGLVRSNVVPLTLANKCFCMILELLILGTYHFVRLWSH
jgi:hypothetical protein